MKINKSLLKDPIAEGGEGTIYEKNGYIIKIYKDENHIDKNEKKNKIELLLQKRLPKNVIGPKELVFDEKGNFIGYVMEKVKGEEMKKLSNRKFVKSNNITVKDILKMMLEVINTLNTLHKDGIVIGDLNDVNILFNDKNEVFFIDSDSWQIEKFPCTVYTETFRDPLLTANSFTEKTDYYAYAVLAFKSLTRVHPFGGTFENMDILERIKKRISVIDNKEIIIPNNSAGWSFLPQTFIQSLKSIFENDKRMPIDSDLNEIYQKLTWCKKHNDYYYGRFNHCPVCESDAKIITKPTKEKTQSGIPYKVIWNGNNTIVILSEETYLTDDYKVTHIKSGKNYPFKKGEKTYFLFDGDVLIRSKESEIIVEKEAKNFTFEKKYKTQIKIKNNKVYYISKSNSLTELEVDKRGNGVKTIAKVSNNHFYEVYDTNHYLLFNEYDKMKVINVDGYNHILKKNSKIENISMQFDLNKKQWLVIIEWLGGKFETIVFQKEKIVYQNDSIRFTNDINNICLSNEIIFKAEKGLIRGFDFVNNRYKEFVCPVVTEDMKLIRKGKGFVGIAEKEMIIIG